MVHPLKAATSFDCDGCGHHASFHSMENHQDDEVVRRWKIRTAESDALRLEALKQGAHFGQEGAPKRRRTTSGLQPNASSPDDVTFMESRHILEAGKKGIKAMSKR